MWLEVIAAHYDLWKIPKPRQQHLFHKVSLILCYITSKEEGMKLCSTKIIVEIFSSRIFPFAAQNIFMTEKKFQMCAPKRGIMQHNFLVYPSNSFCVMRWCLMDSNCKKSLLCDYLLLKNVSRRGWLCRWRPFESLYDEKLNLVTVRL